MKSQDPEPKHLKERPVVYVSFTGNYMGSPQIFQNLFGELCGWAGPKGLISSETVFLSSYQDDPQITPPDQFKLHLCMSISDDVKVEGNIQKKVLPGGKYIVMRTELAGPEEYGPAWNAVAEWMLRNNYEVDMSRPSYEIYLNNPEEHPDKHHIVDICVSAGPK